MSSRLPRPGAPGGRLPEGQGGRPSQPGREEGGCLGGGWRLLGARGTAPPASASAGWSLPFFGWLKASAWWGRRGRAAGRRGLRRPGLAGRSERFLQRVPVGGLRGLSPVLLQAPAAKLAEVRRSLLTSRGLG